MEHQALFSKKVKSNKTINKVKVSSATAAHILLTNIV